MEEIQDLAKNGPTSDEMLKIQNQLINDTIRVRQSSINRARELAEFTLYDGDPKLFNSELDEFLQISPERIRAAVDKYLNTENRALLDIVTAGNSN
jgi:zinc protease